MDIQLISGKEIDHWWVEHGSPPYPKSLKGAEPFTKSGAAARYKEVRATIKETGLATVGRLG